MRKIRLTEFKTEKDVLLSREQMECLRRVAPSIAVTPSLTEDSRYDLTPDSKVGAVILPELAIEIRPKFEKLRSVLFLLAYTLDPKAWKDTQFSFDESSYLHEAVVPGFATQLRRAFRRGVLQGYRQEEAALPGVKGQIRFGDQLRDRYGLFPPVEVRYDEFTQDIEPNRVLKAALVRLERMVFRNSEYRRKLRLFRTTLDGVQGVEYSPYRLPSIQFHRLNEHYRPAVELAKLILRSSAVELRHGSTVSTSFLVDMNDVFENFVAMGLREALGLSEREFPQNAAGRSVFLDRAGAIGLEPDLSWWSGSRCLFVGDVKYKPISVAGIKHPDLYQALAYALAMDLSSALLVYAAGEGELAEHEVVHVGRTLRVVPLDLSGEPEDLLAEINGLATRVREWTSRDAFVAKQYRAAPSPRPLFATPDLSKPPIP